MSEVRVKWTRNGPVSRRITVLLSLLTSMAPPNYVRRGREMSERKERKERASRGYVGWWGRNPRVSPNKETPYPLLLPSFGAHPRLRLRPLRGQVRGERDESNELWGEFLYGEDPDSREKGTRREGNSPTTHPRLLGVFAPLRFAHPLGGASARYAVMWEVSEMSRTTSRGRDERPALHPVLSFSHYVHHSWPEGKVKDERRETEPDRREKSDGDRWAARLSLGSYLTSFQPLRSPYNHFQAFQSSTVVTGWEASERSGPDQTTGDDDRRRNEGLHGLHPASMVLSWHVLEWSVNRVNPQ